MNGTILDGRAKHVKQFISSSRIEQAINLFKVELEAVRLFAESKDERKNQWFLYSLRLSSGSGAALIAILTLAARTAGNDQLMVLQKVGAWVVAAILIASGLLNAMILKQYTDAHVGRILAISQLNLLRGTHAALLYTLSMGKVPINSAELQKKDSLYWQLFGCNQIAEIDNKGLIERENKFFTSAGFTLASMLLMSLAPLLMPFGFYFALKEGFIVALIGGGMALTLVLVFIVAITITRRALIKKIEKSVTTINSV